MNRSLPEILDLARRGVAVAAHSDAVQPGGIFVVLPAAAPDNGAGKPGGEVWIPKALERGAGVVVCEERHLPALTAADPNGRVDVCLTTSTRKALGALAQAFYHTDAGKPEVIGITGTNGKTTGTYLLERLFTGAGRTVGVIGTVEYRRPGYRENASLTTPGCLELHRMLADMHAHGVDLAVMETASHALDQERIAGIEFAAGALTNVTQDHLDYHGDMEAYFQTKARFFRPLAQGGVPLENKAKIINVDDPYGRRLAEELPDALCFGLTGGAPAGRRMLSGRILSLTPSGMHLSMTCAGDTWELRSPMVGAFNASNLLGAQAMGLAMGLKPEAFAALEDFAGVPGRLERVPNPQGLHVFVDYAHTPDALTNVLTALRAAGFARIVTVFGCGGNRDRTKRPLMGRAVAALTDVAVLTSDNPRHEEPEAIIADVLPGLIDCRETVVEPDRRVALRKALAMMGPDDALLVAGKGHESYQQIGDVKIPFSDQAVIKELLQCA
jgi:UDP-N-acetylmuramoyl-L-alanyl-D-glutamate--2,6-diaminopimelate ligase